VSVKPNKLIDWVRATEARPDPPWLLRDMLQGDSAIQITGAATRSYKTWFAMTVGLVLASGKRTELLDPIAPVGVLMLEQEGPAKPTADRFRKLERGLGIDMSAINFHFEHRRPFFLDSASDMNEVSTFVKQNDVRLVIIDTLAKVTRGDENSSRDVGAAMRGIDSIRNAAPGCSVMYLHHIRKPPGENRGPIDIDDETRGSSALNGFYDEHLAFRKRFDSQKHLDLTVRGNQLPEKYYEVTWFVETEKAYLQMREAQAGDVAESLKDELVNKLMPDRGYRQSDLARIWQLTSAQVKQVVGQLLQENVLEERSKQLWLR
jgi:RecA-family ATPase